MEYFGKAGLNGQTAKITTVKQVREIGSAVLTCEDLSNWATDTPVFFATYKVDIDTQKIIPNSQINWRGKVNVENNTIVEIQADSDTPDKGNAIGDIVECLPTAGWANSLVDGISVIHKQDGTLKSNVVKGDNIDFASFKSNVVKGDNIDFSTLKNYNSTMPRKSQTVSIGYGLDARFLRIGDLVQVSISKVIQSSSNGDNIRMGETVPADFHPIQTAHVSVQAVAGASSDRNLDIRFEPDGSIYHSGANITGHTRFTGSAMYFAKNPM